MKYIHNGKDWIAFFAAYGHADIATRLHMKPTHAGFLQFGNPEVREFHTFGNSHSLGLKAEEFQPDRVWAALNKDQELFISNESIFLLEFVVGSYEIQPAEWKLSLPGEYESSVYYPGHPSSNFASYTLQRH